MRSAQDLLTSYGCSPCNAASSSYGSSSWSPYALSLEAMITAFVSGLRRAASSSAHVPRMLVSSVEMGFRFATPTIACAARWKTVSISYSPSERSSTSWSRTSPRTTVTLFSRPVPSSVLRGTQSRTSAVTLAPSSTSRRTSQPPSSPVAPVTNTGRSCQCEFFFAFISKSSRAASRRPTGIRDCGGREAYPSAARTLRVGRRATVPRRRAARRRGFEVGEVAKLIHRLPDPFVSKGAQLSLGGEPLERLLFPERIVAVDVVQNLWFEHEESAVDPAFARLVLLGERAHFIALQLEAAESRGRAHGRDRRQLAVRLVECDQFADVHVAHAVAVRDPERFRADPVLPLPEAAAGLCIETGIDEVDGPVLAALAVRDRVAVRQVDGEVARHRAVREKVRPHHLGLVPEGEHELVEPVRGVEVHDVPEDRPAADFDHRLWASGGLLRQPRAEPTGQDHNLHRAS